MTKMRTRLSYANVMASIAVFAALGGGAFAATVKADKDSVVSSSIRNGKVKSADLRDGGVGTSDIADNAVGAGDIADGSVGGGDIADDGVTGQDVGEATLGTVPDSSRLDGYDSAEFIRYGAVLPSGASIRGVWGGREYGAGNPMIQDYSFPVPGSQLLSDAEVNFAAAGTSGNVGNDDDPSCTGSVTSPSAPPGKVCLYVSGDGLLAGPDSAEGDAAAASRRGFQVRGPSSPAGDVEAHGSWAYTAP